MSFSQMNAVSAGRLKRNQIAELNARQALLPQIVANKRRSEDISRQEGLNVAQKAQWDRSYSLQKSQMKAQEKQNRMGIGLAAGKLGLNILGQYGSSKASPSRGTIGSLFSKSTPSAGKGIAGGAGSMFSNINIGNIAGGAGIGFGLSSVIGGKSKLKKAAIGAVGAGLAGGLMGGGFSGALSSGIGGALGGLFG